ncbi:MAG TPA: NAD-dependent epimerase/dehydratase family protein, partial [Burkholderiaceae bacterium]
MRVLVCGATGCVGTAVANALRSRGHTVIVGARGAADGRDSLPLDFMQPVEPAVWRDRLRERRIDAVVNCVGILMASRAQSFERIHTAGPVELFRGAAQAGVARIVQVSALGVDDDAASLASPYLLTKRRADEALAALPIDGAVLRPSLVFGPNSQSAALFATLAGLPLIGLPGRGRQRVQPIHVFELAEAAVRLLEQAAPCRGVYTLGGAAALTYREMLAQYRDALQLAAPLWLPLPMPLMRVAAWAAEALPQKVFCRDTIAMLERGSVPADNAAPRLLGRTPSSLAHGLAVTPPRGWIDLRVEMPAPVALALRLSIVAMWWITALITTLMPQASGVLRLLARCGFEGRAGVLMMVASCTLNAVLGALLLRRPPPWVWPLQIVA